MGEWIRQDFLLPRFLLIRSADRLGSPLHVIPLALPSGHALKTFDPDSRINFPHRLNALSMPLDGVLKIILLPLLVVKTYLDSDPTPEK